MKYRIIVLIAFWLGVFVGVVARGAYEDAQVRDEPDDLDDLDDDSKD